MAALALGLVPRGAAGTGTFSNPLTVGPSPDPWIVWDRTSRCYCMTFTQGGGVEIWKSPTLAGFRQPAGTGSGVEHVPAWKPDAGERYRFQVWAPELHQVDGRWYLYFTATTAAGDPDHRLFVMEGQKESPLGPYTVKHQITFDRDDTWAIDPTVFQHQEEWYLVWAGWNNTVEKRQELYITRLRNPWTVEGDRHLIASPTFAWEKEGAKPVNEGPEALASPDEKRLFIVYSASFFTSPKYCLGMLTYRGGDLLAQSAWEKSPRPVFEQRRAPGGGVFGPGHNGFFKSPDGREDWIVYHARNAEEWPPGRPSDARTARAQRFTWKADGTPDFGQPVLPGVELPEPSGTGDTR
jgi:GH43 family beta-xylosidase